MPRQRRHLYLSIFVLAACIASLLLAPGESGARMLGRGFGYASIFLLLLTLSISSWMALRGRRAPLSSMARRDIGIWTAITGGIHALLSWMGSPDIALLHATEPTTHEMTQWALIAGDRRLGIIVGVILAGLLVLSNDRAIRALGARSWKVLQRMTYPLIALVCIHALGHQALDERDLGWGIVLLILVLATIASRVLGRFSGTIGLSSVRFSASGAGSSVLSSLNSDQG
ncbi:MAG: hypothetical protein ACKVVP_22275 [Chloroflexota bacterium]